MLRRGEEQTEVSRDGRRGLGSSRLVPRDVSLVPAAPAAAAAADDDDDDAETTVMGVCDVPCRRSVDGPARQNTSL